MPPPSAHACPLPLAARLVLVAFVPLLPLLLLAGPSPARADPAPDQGLEGTDWSCLPMRPLARPSDRPLDTTGPRYFVDASRGDDDAAVPGTQEKPWKTIARGMKALQPGDTLVLRGGIYRECPAWTASGRKEAPITLRSYPGELAILDGGLREFFDDPRNGWEPDPDGAPGEYRSVRSFPQLAHIGGRGVGHFADSMVPLHPYRFRIDLQTDNPFWNVEAKDDSSRGVYCGPGVWLDSDGEAATHRLHIRLAPTRLPGIGRDNYHGASDPRSLRLVLGGCESVLTLRGVRHVRVLDLVLRGAKGATVSVADAEDLELDGLTMYAGSKALALDHAVDVRIRHSSLRGLSAPWSFRNHQKYRGIDSFLLTTGEYGKGECRDVDLACCDVTDHHDALALMGARSITVRQCFIDNFNDDGIDFGPKQTDHRFYVFQNVLRRCFQVFTLHGGKGPGPIVDGRPGSGAYIARNVLDLRVPVYSRLPRSAADPQEVANFGRACIDHGSPVWPLWRIYHNTVLYREFTGNRRLYGAGMVQALRGTARWVENNVFVHMTELPETNFADGESDLVADYNLLWSLAKGAAYEGDFLAQARRPATKKSLPWFEASKRRYPDGWTAHDRFADPRFASLPAEWAQPAKLTPLPGSPVIDAGVALPADWPDPVRGQDEGKPDLGAIPAGVEPWPVGAKASGR
ncbi:MAG: hypothetical protein HYZ53_09535 [Planctomycetes bacterium]|nr:hypothetical protein [Planctomycetota bacterium]